MKQLILLFTLCMYFTTYAQRPVLVKDFNGTGNGNVGNEFIEFANHLLFTADDGIHGVELWITDGTDAGSEMLTDINEGAGDSNPANFTRLGNRIYFTATDSAGLIKVYSTSGLVGSTRLLKDVIVGSSFGFGDPIELVVSNGKLFFAASTTADGKELWVSTGSTPGTSLLKNIASGTNSSNPQGLTDLNGKLLFSASDDSNGTELWVSDGTTAGTVLLQDINTQPVTGLTGVGSSNPKFITKDSVFAYFSARDASNGTELYLSNGTTITALVKNINPGAASSNPSGFTRFKGINYFAADSAGTGVELWRTNTKNTNTFMRQDINPGAASSNPKFFTEYANGLYFNATHVNFGPELYLMPPTGIATLVNDFIPGAQGADPHSLVVFDGRLFFVANNDNHGTQVHVLDTFSNSFIFLAVTGFQKNIDVNTKLFPALGSLFFAAEYFPGQKELYKIEPAATYINNVEPTLQFSVYPNPANEKLRIALTYQENQATVQIYSLQGALLLQTEIENNASVNLQTLTSGMYLVQVTAQNKTGFTKLVKQ